MTHRFFSVAVLSLASSLAGAGAVDAATVTYTLNIDVPAQTWTVTAAASQGDNAGLALVSVPLVNVDFSVNLALPQARLNAPNVGTQGFYFNRVAGSAPVGAAQDTFGGGTDQLVYGFGQSAGSLSGNFGNVFTQKDYDALLLVAQGTFTGPLLPAFDTNQGAANVFTTPGGTATQAATLSFLVNFIPEPASVALLLSGVAMLAIRRR